MGVCILIAGLPASGKTTFAGQLGEALSLPVISKDRIKELLYDTVGFGSRAEKVTLSVAGTKLLVYYAESLMRTGQDFILENNFEHVTKPPLEGLVAQYAYRTVTVRFGGDLRVIYARFLQREQDTGRHPGHKTGHAYPAAPEDAGLLNAPMSFDDFVAGVESRGIRDFSMGGDEMNVDATHFGAGYTERVIRQVRLLLGGRYTP